MRQLLRYAAIVVTSALADAALTLFVLASSRNWILVAVLINASIPFLNFVGTATFVEALSTREKFYVTAAVSLGMLLGSAATLLAFAK